MKLHLGCGSKKLEGWINIDSVAAFNPDLIHDITKPLPYPELSVDEILAEDLLEHFDKYMRFFVFYEWVRVLKIGGKITVQVPNFKKILFRYFKFGFEAIVDLIFGETLWESKTYIGDFGIHKWGYSEKTFKGFVKVFGIHPIKFECIGLNMRLIGIKERHIDKQDLYDIKIYSYANKKGNGDNYVTLGFARKMIENFASGGRNNEEL